MVSITSRRCLWTAGVLPAVLALLAALPQTAGAVALDDENPITIVLDDGTQVTLLPQATSIPPPSIPAPPQPPQPLIVRTRPQAYAAPRIAGARTSLVVAPRLFLAAQPLLFATKYYYLPTNLRLSRRPDGTPEFLFLMYTTEKRVDQGGAQGGLLHFLMEWGLTPEQERELAAKLKEKIKGAELAGAVPLEYEGDSGSFQIVSGTLSSEGEGGLTYSLVTSGKAPLVPGGKVAAASRLSPEGAQLLGATFSETSSITDLSVALNYAYTTLAPAAKGTITFHWSKLETHHDQLNAEYKRWQSGTTTKKYSLLGIPIWKSETPQYSYSYDEIRQQYDFLLEKNIVEVKFDELVSDERVAKVRDAFFDYFLKAVAEPASPQMPPPPESDEKKKDEIPDIRHGNSYTFNRTIIENSLAKKDKTISLNYRMAIKRPISVVANLSSWYDTVRDNPRCVGTVNLNDPFFQHRDINFILDLDAKEMFDEAVNYVTVNVRKKRDKGNDFEDHVTIDANYIKENGISATVTYSRGEDTNPDVYEYQTQWSLRGGNVFPENPPWIKGSWEGVTLAPPVKPRTIEFEGDLDEMKASGITRATAQVRYFKFGQETEENIHLSPAQGQPLVSRQIFMDRDSRGYVCRLILNHKTEGKLVLPWGAKVGDDYIYAAIPEDLMQTAVYKEAGKQLEQTATEKVLDRFKELIGG
ncbi:MAG: hypothetical protein QM473_07230 [Acidobacteriota bacterium]|nr:hypothetical protein [Acidobacteriota bacterium]